MSERYWDSMNAAIEQRVQAEVKAAGEREYRRGFFDALEERKGDWQSGYECALIAGFNQGVAESGGNPAKLKPQPERRET